MTNFFVALARGLKVMGILMAKLPLILMDGKVTLKEMTDLFIEICSAAGWTLDIKLPEEIVNNVVGVWGEQKLTEE
jgi:hypothetical protein